LRVGGEGSTDKQKRNPVMEKMITSPLAQCKIPEGRVRSGTKTKRGNRRRWSLRRKSSRPCETQCEPIVYRCLRPGHDRGREKFRREIQNRIFISGTVNASISVRRDRQGRSSWVGTQLCHENQSEGGKSFGEDSPKTGGGDPVLDRWGQHQVTWERKPLKKEEGKSGQFFTGE